MGCGRRSRLQRVVHAAPDPSPLLRPGLLDGLRVMVAGGGVESPFGAAVAARCEGLGGRVERLEVDPFGDEPPAPEGEVDVLVWDGALGRSRRSGVAAVRAALDGAWLAIRPVARPATSGSGSGGKLLLLAPLPGDAHAEGATDAPGSGTPRQRDAAVQGRVGHRFAAVRLFGCRRCTRDRRRGPRTWPSSRPSSPRARGTTTRGACSVWAVEAGRLGSGSWARIRVSPARRVAKQLAFGDVRT